MEAVPMFDFEGMKLPTFQSFIQKGVENAINDIINLQTRPDDILICTFGKSGTHWIYEIVSMLLRNTTELNKDTKVDTMLEVMVDLSKIDSIPSPRILDTHLKFKYLPKKIIEDKGKIVHMIRNPKDVCVSSYYHALKDKCTNFNGTFEEFFDGFILGETFPYGPWFDYELEMEQAEKNHPRIIHTVHYEQMKKEPEKEIRRLADYLGVSCSDGMVADIAMATSFQNMQKKKIRHYINKYYRPGFSLRIPFTPRPSCSGQIGDWKNHLTVAQNERFDALFKKKMNNSSYKIEFEGQTRT